MSVSIREVYSKFDELKKYIDIAYIELREKAEDWEVEGTDMIDMINKLQSVEMSHV